MRGGRRGFITIQKDLKLNFPDEMQSIRCLGLVWRGLSGVGERVNKCEVFLQDDGSLALSHHIRWHTSVVLLQTLLLLSRSTYS